MKIKTSELTNIPLRYAVAIAEGGKDFRYKGCRTYWITINDEERVLSAGEAHSFVPDIRWTQGGPIIERERIKVAPNLGGTWLGQIRHETTHPLVDKPVLAGWTNKHGPTPLIAAMRCYVASISGDEIEVPDELL